MAALFKGKKISELPALATDAGTLLAGQKGADTGSVTVQSILDLVGGGGGDIDLAEEISSLPTYTSVPSPSYNFVPFIVQDSYSDSGWAAKRISIENFLPQSDATPLVVRLTTSSTFNSNASSTTLSGTTIISSPDCYWTGSQFEFDVTGRYRVTIAANIENAFGYAWPAQHSQQVLELQKQYLSVIPDSSAWVKSRYETTVSNTTNTINGSMLEDFIMEVGNDAMTFGGGWKPIVSVMHNTAESSSQVFNAEFAITIKRIGDFIEV